MLGDLNTKSFLLSFLDSSETTTGDVGLVVEVFSKEMLIINHPIGHKYIPLNTIPYGYPNEMTSQWYTLDRELVTQNGVVVGSKDPTGHMLMLDCRFELPYGER